MFGETNEQIPSLQQLKNTCHIPKSYNLIRKIMNKIVQKAVKYFQFQERPSDTKILEHCKKSDLYEAQMDSKKLISQINKGLEKSKKDVLRRLDFHFARETNKLLFDIYQIILQAPNGLKYKDIGNILNDEKTNNIAISHYCRKLYKANFISVSYVKEGTLVTAIKYKTKKEELKEDDREEVDEDGDKPQKDELLKTTLKDGFLIKELSIDNNILLNMSGMESLLKDGLTKEEISGNIFKTSEKKTISRLIENSKFQRDGERKGRIYGFRFKGDLNKIKKFVGKSLKVPIRTAIVTLQSDIEQHLHQKYPDINVPNLLQYLIDNSKRQSSTKQTRQCDPIKLSRFIYILNYINHKPSTIQNMSHYIIQQDKEKHTVNIGTMHKKSLSVILQTLRALDLIILDDDVIYPTWKTLDKLVRQPSAPNLKKIGKEIQESKNVNSLKKAKKQVQCKVLSEKEAHQQFTAEQIFSNIKSSWLGILRYGFKEIKRIGFRKQQPQIPRPHALHILDKSPYNVPSLRNPSSIESLFQQIDLNLSSHLVVQQELKLIDAETKKYLRMYPQKKVTDFIKRFGRSSRETIEQLVERKVMEVEGEGPEELYRVSSENRYFI